MKFRIHFAVNNYEDSVDIEGESLEEIKEKVNKFMQKRNLDFSRNNFWSEEIK